jgi:ABC-2 type transport system permease protein
MSAERPSVSPLTAAWAYARKDWTLFLRDRTALLLALALPLVLAAIFGVAMGGMAGDEALERVELALEDLDDSPQSQALIAALRATDGLELRLGSDVRKRVANGRSPAALRIEPGFAEAHAAGGSGALVLLRDPARAIEQQIVAGNLLGVLARFYGEQRWQQIESGMRASGASDADLEHARAAFGSSAGGAQAPQQAAAALGLRTEDVLGGRDDSGRAAGRAHAVSGIAVMMLLFGVAAVGGTLLQERNAGTLERLQLAPVPGGAILGGKVLFSIASGALQLALLFGFGWLVFHVPVGRAPLALALLCLAVIFAATGLGLVLAVWCRSQKQLEGLSTLVILAMSALGGSWFPLAITPAWFQTAGHFTLNAWAMDGFQGLFWYGKDLLGIAREIGVLLALGAVLFLLAWRGWKRNFELRG